MPATMRFHRDSRFAPILKTVGKGFRSDAPGTAVHGNIAPRPGDIVVPKTRVCAFSTTNLDRQLKERGIVTLMLAGISTSGVVLSTSRDAADHDQQLIVVADARATRSAEHEFLVGKVFSAQAKVLRLADRERLLSGVDADTRKAGDAMLPTLEHFGY
ncbi:MAG: cysteine hydrolase [Candidatus Velthaea sp.]